MSNNSCTEISKSVFMTGYSVTCVLGFLSNCIAIYLLCHLVQRSPTTIYMKNLACADLLLTLTLPIQIYGYTFPKTAEMLHIWLCKVAGSFILLNMYGSIFLLTCISLDRCLAVCYPLRSRHIRQKAPWICAGVWVLNVVACLSAYLSKGRNNNSNSTGDESICFHGKPPFVTMTGPVIGALSIGFLIPAGVMSFSSVALWRAMERSTVVQEGIINKVKVVRMLITNVSIFLLCFLPYHIVLFLYQVFNENCSLNKAYSVGLLIACFNTVLDPFLYYFTSETMKKAVKEMKDAKASELSYEKHRPIISSVEY
ncbi:lysophosphatidic acid receptor 4-like [Gastrophryne carolinensis]